MVKQEHIVSYTADELAAMRQRGEGKTDWERVRAMTDDEVEAAIDHEDEGEFDRSTTQAGIPEPQRELTFRVDVDVIEWFKAQSANYQTRMNAVLRNFVDAEKRKERSTTPHH